MTAHVVLSLAMHLHIPQLPHAHHVAFFLRLQVQLPTSTCMQALSVSGVARLPRMGGHTNTFYHPMQLTQIRVHP